MTEGTVKRSYRKVKTLVLDTVVANPNSTLEEVSAKSGIGKWYCKQKLNKLVEKGKVTVTEGKYNVAA